LRKKKVTRLLNIWESNVEWSCEARDEKHQRNEDVPERLEAILRIQDAFFANDGLLWVS
jgi:hypothetical protein